jgi:hypothetical protein
MVVDVAEHEIERPQKKQKLCSSGKQGYHTLKSQVIADQESEQIICVHCGQGRVHDFRLWKESKIGLNKEIELLGDKSYQGIQKIHHKSQTPHKEKRKEKLSKEKKSQLPAVTTTHSYRAHSSLSKDISDTFIKIQKSQTAIWSEV